MRIKVGVIGATGYTGLELLEILARHPKVDISAITSESYGDMDIGEVFPRLRRIVNLRCEKLDVERVASSAEIIFTALPHKVSMNVVRELHKLGRRVIDLSADFRLKDAEVYRNWYGADHIAPDLLDSAIYGLPEINRDLIPRYPIIAVPGCYPTSIILGALPLFKNRLVEGHFIADSKSGVSGAGRKPSLKYHYPECNESISAYGVGTHRHTPEIEQELSSLFQGPVTVMFTPHLVPMDRGILSTIYLKPKGDFKGDRLWELYNDFYSREPFVRILPRGTFPSTKDVAYTNFCDIGVMFDERTRTIIIVSAIDNLGKGAAGQAVQNMNIICGFEEGIGMMMKST
ncbi:MAG: N-acetyl-gamma-glutamyl-phosphate reductase [bacterium]